MSRARDKAKKIKKRQKDALSQQPVGTPVPSPALNEWLEAQELVLDETELEE